MTLEELQGSEYLSHEIERCTSEIADMESRQKNTAIPAALRQQYNAAVEDCRQVLIDRRERSKQDLNKIQQFFDEIDDPFIRAVFTERFINAKTWWEVAYCVEKYGRYTAGGLKKIVYRYLERYNAAQENG